MGRTSRDGRGPGVGKSQQSAKRSWMASMAFSVAVVAGGILISATVNPFSGLAVHWDWMAVLAPTLFVVLTMVLRNRWA